MTAFRILTFCVSVLIEHLNRGLAHDFLGFMLVKLLSNFSLKSKLGCQSRKPISELRREMTPRELDIFDLRILSDDPKTLREIGDNYGISRERVRQVQQNIIKKMKASLEEKLPDFADHAEDQIMD